MYIIILALIDYHTTPSPLGNNLYLSPEKCEAFISLRSLGLSKDPKDAQR